jgi:hypothetical protein
MYIIHGSRGRTPYWVQMEISEVGERYVKREADVQEIVVNLLVGFVGVLDVKRNVIEQRKERHVQKHIKGLKEEEL